MNPKFVYDSQELGTYVSPEEVNKAVASVMERYPEAVGLQLVAGGGNYGRNSDTSDESVR